MTPRTISATLLLAALLGAPAIAQAPKPTAPPAKGITSPNDLNEQQMDEIYCIYDEMGKDKDAPAVADAISGDETKTEAARKVYDKARAVCVAKYVWSEKQAGVSSMLASSAATSDIVESELTRKGFDDKKKEAVLEVSDKVSADDMNKLIYAGDKIEEATLARVRKAMADSGIAPDAVELSIVFMQSSLQEYDALMQWVDEKLY